ncbi:N-acetylmuramoyl-L-alanine amidase [Streptomyces sp. NBC_01218]|uniref:N-acetylmuramoyl-L-alanine amidase n=1 Tax=unclassified Streptomyces TaxID=2593676 RepID=UPI0023B94050|nr:MULTISPECIES: N-acetylmuramoyl-L-alanine amidase [unclassified Streptomyces]WEH38134.1 N-acetylmuramoyl-L-alanine amidase [Streptomyces sp. AM 2-1-1]WSQ49791.1 N-acetylmuramoyl-L-alanine amidase [Streptomyces sp. NBC_01218]
MHRRRILRGAAGTAAGLVVPAPVRGVDAPSAGTDSAHARWARASPANYTVPGGVAPRRVDRVVVHVTQQTFTQTIGIFQNPANRVSVHYLVRSGDGYTVQCVRERDIAWHAGAWDHNVRSIGIEHEGWVDRPEYFTAAMYERSARLTADICDRHGIPRDRTHIIGHYEVPGTDHTDPGPLWDWDRYLGLVRLA